MTDVKGSLSLNHKQSLEKSTSPGGLFLIGFSLFLAVLAFGLALLMLFSFSRTGEAFLTIRDDSVGEVLMRRGDRINRAGYEEEALAYYEKALRARFAGPQNRTHSLEAAGLILWKKGDYQKAREYLEASLKGIDATTAPYEALIDIHLKENETAEARELLDAWQQATHDSGDASEHWKLLLASGRLALAEGREEEGRAIFQKGKEESDLPAFAAQLAQLYARAGEHEKALSCLEAYFLQGGDDQGAAMRDLYRTQRSVGSSLQP
jgi:tetratricopeptide (TPR) repeat protein